MKQLILAVLAGSMILTGAADAQEVARERARTTLPPQLFQEVEALAARAAEEGIPTEPLFNKALEGMAKRVPSDQLLPAVNRYAVLLGEARQAFRGMGNGPLLVAGADALQRGVGREVLERLASPEEGVSGPSPMAVLVLADLVEAGVPTERALGVLHEAMRMRTRDQEMLGISARVRQLMRQGQSPQEAAEQVRRALQRGRGGGGGMMGPPVPPGSEPLPRSRRRGSGGQGGG